MIYNESLMLSEWKIRNRIIPLRNDGEYDRRDAFDINSYLRREIDTWYFDLLDNGDIKDLDPEDITREITLLKVENGVATFKLPDHCRRVVQVCSDAWQSPARILKPCDREARYQLSRFSRGRRADPVAIVNGNLLTIYSLPSTAHEELAGLTKVLAATYRKGEYRFNYSALRRP